MDLASLNPLAGDLDAALARYEGRSPSVVVGNALFAALPCVDPLPPALTLEEVVQQVVGGTDPAIAIRARQIAAEEGWNKARMVLAGLDAGDGALTIWTSLRQAVAYYLRRKGGEARSPEWAQHQGEDAVAKALVISHVVERMFPAEEDPLLCLLSLEAGRDLLAYHAAVEVGLPFVDGGALPRGMLASLSERLLDAQAGRLAPVLGMAAVQSAREGLPPLLRMLDRLLEAEAASLGEVAATVQGRLPLVDNLAGRAATVVAASADVLPMYTWLGTRVIAEGAVWMAAREAGRIQHPSPVALEWLRRYGDPPPEEVAPAPSAAPASLEDVFGAPVLPLQSTPPAHDPIGAPELDPTAPPPLPRLGGAAIGGAALVEAARPASPPPPLPSDPPPAPTGPPPVPISAPPPLPQARETGLRFKEPEPPPTPQISAPPPTPRPAPPPPPAPHPAPPSPERPQKQVISAGGMSSPERTPEYPELEEEKGISWTAIAVVMGVLAALLCGGFALFGTGGGLYWLAGEETQQSTDKGSADKAKTDKGRSTDKARSTDKGRSTDKSRTPERGKRGEKVKRRDR